MKTILVLISFVLLSTELWSAEVIGRITKLRGTVTRQNENLSLNDILRQGDQIFVGDKIESENGSFAKVLMKDDTIFSIGPQTEFVFEKFKEKEGNDRDATYNLVRGKLRSLFTKKAPTRSLKIKTPVASMAVRGTDIAADVYRLNGEIRTDIGLISGSLEVHSRGKIINLKPQDIYEGSRGEGKGAQAQFIKKRIEDSVFKMLKQSEKKGGVPFLNDAFKKGGKPRSADFSKISFKRLNNKDKPSFVVQKEKEDGQGFESKVVNEQDIKGFKVNRAPASLEEDKNPYSVVQDVQERKGPIEDMKLQNAQFQQNPDQMDPDTRRKLLRRALMERRTQLPALKPCPIGTVMVGGVCRKPLILEPTTDTRLDGSTINTITNTTDTTNTLTRDPNITTTLQDASTGTTYDIQKTSGSITTTDSATRLPTATSPTTTTTTVSPTTTTSPTINTIQTIDMSGTTQLNTK